MIMKMKAISYFLLLLPCLLTAGCIDEDISACGGEVTCYFDYIDGDPEGSEWRFIPFFDRLENVEMRIYRESDGAEVQTVRLDRDALWAFQEEDERRMAQRTGFEGLGRPGVRLTLPVGEYTAVLWGNVHERTVVTQDEAATRSGGRMADARIRHRDLADPYAVIDTDDSLCYARIAALRIADNLQRDTVSAHFEPATVSIEVHVLGLAGARKLDANPHIRIDGLKGEVYDFGMRACALPGEPSGGYTFRPLPYPEGAEAYDAANDVYTFRTKVHHSLSADTEARVSLMLGAADDETLCAGIGLREVLAYAANTIRPKYEKTVYVTFQLAAEPAIDATVRIYPVPWRKISVDVVFE